MSRRTRKEDEIVPVLSRWLPVLLSALFVFVASSIVHKVLPFHRNDYKTLPDEDGVMDALRKFDISPGDYVFPCVRSPKESLCKGWRRRWNRGRGQHPDVPGLRAGPAADADPRPG